MVLPSWENHFFLQISAPVWQIGTDQLKLEISILKRTVKGCYLQIKWERRPGFCYQLEGYAWGPIHLPCDRNSWNRTSPLQPSTGPLDTAACTHKHKSRWRSSVAAEAQAMYFDFSIYTSFCFSLAWNNRFNIIVITRSTFKKTNSTFIKKYWNNLL